MELSTLNSFLDWLANRGNPGAAPSGTVTKSVAEVLGLSDEIAPTTSISCNGTTCSSSPYTSPVDVTLAAVDNVGGAGVAAIHYTTDGSNPTNASPTYSSGFTVDQTTTVKFFAVDGAGNAETVQTQEILVPADVTAPVSSITCNGSTCSTGWYPTAPVSVALSATDDPAGSGLGKIYYTTDGSTPTTSSAEYTGSFGVTQTTTVRFFATDVAGNAETSKSQLIRIDTVAPSSSSTCNGSTCSTGWYRTTPVRVALSATENASGSGTFRIYYTTNGSTPTTSSTIYAGPFNVNQTTTVRFFATDVAGNAETSKSQLVQIDAVAPSTAVTCNSAACSTGWYRTAPVQVALAATDNANGSGVAVIYYTTNGSTPTTSSAVYDSPLSLLQTTTVKLFATDVAGNAATVRTQVVRIDMQAPTVAISAPGNNASFQQKAKVTITASASDPATIGVAASGVASVAFYLDGTTLIATDTNAPYSVSWITNKVALGTHVLTAVATDVAGNSTVSSPVTVKIT
jgi:hypothetical protein